MSNRLPEYFKEVLWSYNLEKMDPDKAKKTIIVNTINYGDLKHWRWVLNYYGGDEVLKIVDNTKETEMRKSVKRLLNIILNRTNEKTGFYN